MERPASIVNKDGAYQCKKHASTGMSLGRVLPLFFPTPDTDLTPNWFRLQPMLWLEEADH